MNSWRSRDAGDVQGESQTTQFCEKADRARLMVSNRGIQALYSSLASAALSILFSLYCNSGETSMHRRSVIALTLLPA